MTRGHIAAYVLASMLRFLGLRRAPSPCAECAAPLLPSRAASSATLASAGDDLAEISLFTPTLGDALRSSPKATEAAAQVGASDPFGPSAAVPAHPASYHEDAWHVLAEAGRHPLPPVSLPRAKVLESEPSDSRRLGRSRGSTTSEAHEHVRGWLGDIAALALGAGSGLIFGLKDAGLAALQGASAGAPPHDADSIDWKTYAYPLLFVPTTAVTFLACRRYWAEREDVGALLLYDPEVDPQLDEQILRMLRTRQLVGDGLAVCFGLFCGLSYASDTGGAWRYAVFPMLLALNALVPMRKMLRFFIIPVAVGMQRPVHEGCR